jgi:hypothetical protein
MVSSLNKLPLVPYPRWRIEHYGRRVVFYPPYLVGAHLPKVGSADLQSAVSPICNRQAARLMSAPHRYPRSAECNSAIRQIANLRYAKEILPARGGVL